MFKRIIGLLLILVLAVAVVPVSANAEESQTRGRRWPDEWNDYRVREDEPNDSITSSSAIYSPNYIYSGYTAVGTIGAGCYPTDVFDNFEFYVSEAGTVEIDALTRYSDMTVISGTTISYSAFEVELKRVEDDGRTWTTVASDSTGEYFYYTSSYQYWFSVTANVQPGTYRLVISDGICTGVNQYMCHLSVKACEHSYKAEITPPSCIAEGYTTYTCRHCGKTYVDNYTDIIGHRGVAVAGKPATCTEAGLTEGVTCSVCDYVVKAQEVIPATGHSYGDWERTREPTCTQDGQDTKICSGCGDAIHEPIPAFGHSYGDWVVTQEKSCTEDGKEEKTCAACGDIESRAIPQSHEFEKTVMLAPTDSREGEMSNRCTVCAAETSTVIPMLPAGETMYVIEESVVRIATNAFDGARGLTAITVPSGLAVIEKSAFWNCDDLDAYIEDLAAWINIDFQGSSSNPSGNLYLNGELITDLVIPEGVTEIGAYAFDGCSSITSVTIPSSVTGIGAYAFRNCGMRSAVIPDSVTDIGEYAFANNDLTEITVPGSISEIAFGVFHSCSNLVEVTISDGVTGIEGGSMVNYGYGWIKEEYGAFEDCTSLTRVTLPASLTDIGDYTFSDCSNLTEVHITDLTAWCNINFPDSGMPKGDLYLNGNLITDLVIPNNVSKIKDRVFYDINSLTSVTIPEGVTSIGSYAFYSCDNLSGVTIPGSVSQIGNRAFGDCVGLTDLVISEGVADIGELAFDNCDGLVSITIPGSVRSIGKSAFAGCGILADVILVNGVASIGNQAFSGCYALNSFTIPASVKQMGTGVFLYCNKLDSVHFIGSVPSHTGGVLYNSGKVNVYYPADDSTWTEEKRESLYGRAWEYGTDPKWIPCDHTFEGAICEGETGTCVNCGARILVSTKGHTEVIDAAVEATCAKTGLTEGSHCSVCGTVLMAQEVVPTRGHTEVIDAAVKATCTETGLTEGKHCSLCGMVLVKQNAIPARNPVKGHTEVVDKAAAATCTKSGLTEGKHCSVCDAVLVKQEIIPATAHSMREEDGKRVCEHCGLEAWPEVASGTCGRGLTWVLDEAGTLTISGSGKMDNYAYRVRPSWHSYSDSITSLVIEEGVTSIGSYAFAEYDNLTGSLVIPEGVTSIGSYAFDSCDGLTGDLVIPEGVTSIGGEAFSFCRGFDGSLVLPESLTSIGGSAFRRCSGLTGALVLPESLTSIGEYAFRECSGLTEIEISASVDTIGDYAFGECTGLEKITFHGDAPSVSGNVFLQVTATACYPEENETWTEEACQNYGGTLTWVPYVEETDKDYIDKDASALDWFFDRLEKTGNYLWSTEKYAKIMERYG